VAKTMRKKRKKDERTGKLRIADHWNAISIICRLFCKELVRQNFPGVPTDELLERMIELSLYTEEHLK